MNTFYEVKPETDHGPLIAKIRNHGKINMAPPEFEFFWGGHYSQWAASPFYYDGHYFPTAEHFMMWQKAKCFGDEMRADMILDPTAGPDQVKAIGRKVENYDDAKWSEVRYGVVVLGTMLKFSQNPEFYEIMMERDGDKVIVEASPYDKIWGIGRHANDDLDLRNVYNWDGLNLLGYAVMEARARLRDLKAV